jgi:hypothetical protein
VCAIRANATHARSKVNYQLRLGISQRAADVFQAA